jgi:hypothetical protein
VYIAIMSCMAAQVHIAVRPSRYPRSEYPHSEYSHGDGDRAVRGGAGGRRARRRDVPWLYSLWLY